MDSALERQEVDRAVAVKELSFAGLRRLNPFESYKEDLNAARLEWEAGRTVYKMGAINVFAGTNGGGKSTVLELIDLMREPNRICNLPRENRTRFSHCFWDVGFTDGARVRGTAAPNEWIGLSNDSNLDEDAFKQAVVLDVEMPTGGGRCARRRFVRNISKRKLSAETAGQVAALLGEVGCTVSYWPNDRPLIAAEAVKALNGIAPHLRGLASDPSAPTPDVPFSTEDRLTTPLIGGDDGWISVYLSDDHLQFNNVQLAALPSGWRQLASILIHVENCPPGTICLLEEPEGHLHPSMQRVLVRLLGESVRAKGLQLFVSTHSLTIQSRLTWPSEVDARFFHVTADGMREGIRQRQLLDDLGINGADQGTANGVVWVEGPSDRIYLKHWMEIYCRHTGRSAPVEHVDFMFAYHGGALLAHLTAECDGSSQINVSRINRNFVVVMDDDGDFDETGVVGRSTGAAGKSAILARVAAIGSPACAGLATAGYTIEASLPAAFRSAYFRFDASGVRLVHVAGKKVAIARRYVASHSEWETCFDPKFSMDDVVRALLKTIDLWGRNA